MTTTIAKLSKAQIEAMDYLLKLDGIGDLPNPLGHWQITTVEKLRKTGMIQTWDQEPMTWAEAYRPRYRHFVLTENGKEFVRSYRAKKAADFDRLMGR